MSDTDLVFRVLLPLVWLWLVLAIALNRWRIRRRLGRDPVVARPWRRADTPQRYLERTLALSSLVATADIILNATVPAIVADRWAIRALRESRMIGSIGLVLLAAGTVLTTVAVRQMGLSWRIGIDEQAPGALVSGGLYSRVRHPIYSGMLLATAGLACATADLLSVGVAVAAWVGLPVQARLEEAFLLSRHPEEYADYLDRTRRFWPVGPWTRRPPRG